VSKPGQSLVTLGGFLVHKVPTDKYRIWTQVFVNNRDPVTQGHSTFAPRRNRK